MDSRPTSDNSVRRRRKCLNCGIRWTTYEIRYSGSEGIQRVRFALGDARRALDDFENRIKGMRPHGLKKERKIMS